MVFSKSIFDIIKQRTSWRTYSKRLLEEQLKEKLLETLKLRNFKSPFSEIAGNCRFDLIGMPEFDPDEKKKLGTYGLIKGAQEFIVGAVEKSDYDRYDRENYGYLLEAIILSATDKNLGTCWLGGFFNQSLFSKKIECEPNEVVPAITPVGYTAETRRAKEKIIRSFVKANARYPWDQLFFERDFSTTLSQENIGKYATLLEMVRLGPSAGNKQPWRIIKELDSDKFHFYVRFSKDKKGLIYNKFVRLDIGIAVCHFDLSAKEAGIDGKWAFSEPNIEKPEELKYVISWNGT